MSEITVTYCPEYTPDKNDAAFYTYPVIETVATVETDERWIEVACVGEMRIHHPNGNIIRYSEDLPWNGIHNDDDLNNLTKDDEAFEIWQSNSWFELFDTNGMALGDVWSGNVYYTVDEAVEACKVLLQEPEFLEEFPCLKRSAVVE